LDWSQKIKTLHFANFYKKNCYISRKL